MQVSRWDRLKDMRGVMEGFAERVVGSSPARLALVGPEVDGVSDDPEGVDVLGECLDTWASLPLAARDAIRLVVLPMNDVVANAQLVNAVQRHASVVVQKSLQEGFGLTVTEAMWKSRPVVASAVGGIIGQVPPGTGILIEDPTDLDAFGSSLLALLAHPAEMDCDGTAGPPPCARPLPQRSPPHRLRAPPGTRVGGLSAAQAGAVPDDDAAGDLAGMDSDERVARTARPRLESEARERNDLFGVVHASRRPGHQDAPSLAHRLVHPVDLEAHQLLLSSSSACDTVVLTITSPSLTAKLTGCATGPRRDRNTTLPTPPSPTCASHCAGGELPQLGMATRATPSRPSVHPAAVEVLGAALERDGQQQDRARAQSPLRALLEIAEIARIDPRLLRHLLDALAQLHPPPGDPLGHVSGVGRRDVVGPVVGWAHLRILTRTAVSVPPLLSRPPRAGGQAAERAASRWVTKPTTRSSSITGNRSMSCRHMMDAASSTERSTSSATAPAGSANSASLTSCGSRPGATTRVTMSRLLTVPARLPSPRQSGTESSRWAARKTGRIGHRLRGPQDFDVPMHDVPHAPHSDLLLGTRTSPRAPPIPSRPVGKRAIPRFRPIAHERMFVPS